ncbi:hypothetical protein OGAPHI_002914 [Ogataea philodendri]|uniref:Uncharacterized protein n=1 Tax=Ogataea philodendri TaxID=1378263 RepID=A0A9P8T6N0_9ASCO|nr:uncharacterized protein OGAPHI_002914 [Ogataea philodendri]KAH3667265.1 hypothetical protein OGAPHI_002914 [Ogataea philodendri]
MAGNGSLNLALVRRGDVWSAPTVGSDCVRTVEGLPRSRMSGVTSGLGSSVGSCPARSPICGTRAAVASSSSSSLSSPSSSLLASVSTSLDTASSRVSGISPSFFHTFKNSSSKLNSFSIVRYACRSRSKSTNRRLSFLASQRWNSGRVLDGVSICNLSSLITK